MVCHFNVPKSMEAFYQESGRAGRDQLSSRSLLYYGIDDRKKMVGFLTSIPLCLSILVCGVFWNVMLSMQNH